jgi:hypothetical protein
VSHFDRFHEAIRSGDWNEAAEVVQHYLATAGEPDLAAWLRTEHQRCPWESPKQAAREWEDAARRIQK